MIEESGTIVAIEEDCLWVESIQRSTCQSCAAEKGCGQRLIARITGHTTRLRVLLDGRPADRFQLNQQVTIGIPEDVVVNSSLVVYLVPLAGLLLGALLGDYLTGGDAYAALGGILGLLAGGAGVRWYSRRIRNQARLQPVLLTDVGPIPLVGH